MRTFMLGSAFALALCSPAILQAQTPAVPSFWPPTPAVMQEQTASALLAVLPEAPSAMHPAAIVSAASVSAPPCDPDAGPCPPDPFKRFLDTSAPVPLTPAQKGRLALHNLKDPGNLVTIVGAAAFNIGLNSHTAYGPGWKGFGKNAGVSLLQDTTGEFFGTFLIPSITHEDPHYHRMPHASVPRRFFHALARTVVAQHDDGSNMPNYATLLTYPICSEISNLYVPGIRGNGPSTVARILTGYATDPIENEITEFLPDLAKRIHIRIIFVQQVLNQVATDQYSLP